MLYPFSGSPTDVRTIRGVNDLCRELGNVLRAALALVSLFPLS